MSTCIALFVSGACIALIIGNAPSLQESNPGLQRLAFGAVGLPLALLMTVITGAELVTANMAFVSMAAVERAISWVRLLKSLGLALVGNAFGALIVVWLVHTAGLLEERPDVLALAEHKVAAPPDVLVSKAILCNWLVCMGAYMASIATDVAGKAIAIWLPITSFAALGLEHTVANVFFLGAGWAHGADVTLASALGGNLVWVVLGNALGALLGLVLPFSFAHGSLGGAHAREQPSVASGERHVVQRAEADDDHTAYASKPRSFLWQSTIDMVS